MNKRWSAILVSVVLLLVFGVVAYAVYSGTQETVEDAAEEVVEEELVVEDEAEVTSTSTPTPTISPEPTEAEESALEEQSDTQNSRACVVKTECFDDEYCLKANCSDEYGVCVSRPTSCPKVLSPVCSCDGKTYSSACSAKESRANIAYTGTCKN